jgi:tetratricopeptide (TPR) repeat protein
MRKTALLIFFFAVFLTAPGVCFAETPVFSEANALYQAQDFEAAAKSYQAIVDGGQATGSVYYNLGNAFFRSGQKARALIAYRRASRFLPRDRDLRWNLQVLQTTFQDRSQQTPLNPFLSWPRIVSDYLSVNEVSVILLAAFVVLFAAALFSFLAPGVGAARAVFLAFVFLIAACGLFFLKWLEVKDPRAVVLQKEIPVRYGPSVKETKAFALHEGAEVKVMDESKDWVYVVFDKKNSGWIPKDGCELL